jgi:hypothetical protein
MNLRAILIAVLLVIAGALSALIALKLGKCSLAIFLSGCLLLWFCVLCFQRRCHRVSTLLLVAALVLLFLAIVRRTDKQFVCKECLAAVGTREYFVFGFSRLAGTVVNNNFAGLLAADLGFPCNHKNLEYIRQIDCYGTLFCRHSGHSGTIGLTEDLTWYDADRSKVVAAFGKEYPEIGQRFWQSLVNNDDIEFRREVIGAVVDNNLTDDVAKALNAVPPE